MSTYLELLDDPRWPARASEIRAKQPGKCHGCHTRVKTYVHHVRYIAGRKPWDYPDEYLVALCRECHKAAHQGRYREIIDAGGEWGNVTTLTTKTSGFFRVFDPNLSLFCKNFGKSDIEQAPRMVGVSTYEQTKTQRQQVVGLSVLSC